jgi:hypothetical protein
MSLDLTCTIEEYNPKREEDDRLWLCYHSFKTSSNKSSC